MSVGVRVCGGGVCVGVWRWCGCEDVCGGGVWMCGWVGVPPLGLPVIALAAVMCEPNVQ